MVLFCAVRRRKVDQLAMAQQVLVEHQTLAYVTSALRHTIGWKHQATDLSRKLESLQFVGQSLQRHMKRLLALEEEDGYMSAVLASRPELTDEVEALRQEHGQFRKGLSGILARLRRVQPTDHLTVAKISEDLLVLLQKLDEHSHKETGLIQHALLKDEGGEG
jgi:hemerythrin-like domain-containing protein